MIRSQAVDPWGQGESNAVFMPSSLGTHEFCRHHYHCKQRYHRDAFLLRDEGAECLLCNRDSFARKTVSDGSQFNMLQTFVGFKWQWRNTPKLCLRCHLIQTPLFSLSAVSWLCQCSQNFSQCSQNFSQCYLKGFPKLAENVVTVTVIKCYFHILHFKKCFVKISMVKL